MKKTAKSSGTGKTRHSKSTKKPVTIDLKAQSVKPESKPAAKPAVIQKSKTRSVPKVEPKARTTPATSKSQPSKTGTPVNTTRPKAAADSKSVSKPAEPSVKSTSKSPSNFGRDANNDGLNEMSRSAAKDQPVNETTYTPAPASEQPSNQWPSRLVAGIIGGMIVLTGSTVINGVGYDSSDSDDYVSSGTLDATKDDLTKRIATLESQLKSTNAAPETDIAAIDEKASANQAALEKVLNQVSKADEKLGSLETQLKSATEKLAGIDTTAVGEKMAGVSSQIDKISSQAQDIDARIASLEDVAANKKPAPETLAALTVLQAAIPQLSTDLTGDFDGKLKSVSEKLSQNIASLESGIGELKEGLDAVQKHNEVLQGTLASLQEKTKSIAESEKKAAGSVAAAALKNDIDNGLPFEVSLKNLEAFVGQSTDIAELAPFAKSGVPTVSMLQNEFSELGDKIIQAAKPKPTGDLSERLLSSAKSFIKAKPIKIIDGSGAEAIVSQISANLTSGNVAQASELWSSLPEAGQAISKSWHERLRARVATDTLLSSAVQSFLNSTASQ